MTRYVRRSAKASRAKPNMDAWGEIRNSMGGYNMGYPIKYITSFRLVSIILNVNSIRYLDIYRIFFYNRFLLRRYRITLLASILFLFF